MSSEIAIKVENLSKCYQIYDKPRDRLLQMLACGRKQYFREFWALREVSFEIKKGETVGIIGRNGSGKSTLLQMICGTLNPTSGSIQTQGRIAALLELGSGFNPEFTGRENIYMNAAVLGLSKEETDMRFDDIVSFADIGDFIEQPVKTYSSGMVMRLAFAIIAHVDADLLVIDEALAVGDAFFVQKCMRFLRQFMEKGTVLFVSHDTASVINLCDYAIWIDVGTKRMEGTAKKVSEAYLAALHNQKNIVCEKKSIEKSEKKLIYKDMRQDFINQTTLRNDIELFSFSDKGPHFGTKHAHILDAYLQNREGENLSWIIGGEEVRFIIRVQCLKAFYSPIVGFFVKDRLGQALFGDNTFLTYIKQPLSVNKNETLICEFAFAMPILPVGDYSICIAIAEGTQQEHIHHHWIHDAIMFTSHSSSVTTGLVGIPMKNILLAIKQNHQGVIGLNE